MSYRTPLHVPVELRRDGRERWFRLAAAVSDAQLLLEHIVPEELDGPISVAFHLPGDSERVSCRGRATEEVVGEGELQHAERRVITFIDLDERGRTRIANYVNERLGLLR
jgi:hypothetical protein